VDAVGIVCGSVGIRVDWLKKKLAPQTIKKRANKLLSMSLADNTDFMKSFTGTLCGQFAIT